MRASGRSGILRLLGFDTHVSFMIKLRAELYMKYSCALSIFVVAIQAACSSNDGSTSNPSSNVGGTSSSVGGGASVAGSSSAGGTGSLTVVPAGLPDPAAATALSQQECYVGLKIPNATYTGAGCSASTTTSGVTELGPKAWNDVRLSVSISLNTPPAIGRLDLASLTIRVPNGDVTSTWDAPIDACTATATGSATDSFMGRIYYSIDITCTKPALPTSDASLAPLTLNQFALVTFFST